MRETALENTVHDPENPVDMVFNKIAAYKALCNITNRAISDEQQLDYAYIIFNHCGIFTDYLIKWNEKPDP